MTSEDLAKALDSAGRTGPHMRKALHDVLVLGRTWRSAAIDHQVTESGILRAMRRIGLGKYQQRVRIDAQLHDDSHDLRINP